jgi:phage-related protein
MLVDMEGRMAGLIDSETRLYGTVQQLAEKVQELTEAQKRTEESLRRFLDRSGNGQTS